MKREIALAHTVLLIDLLQTPLRFFTCLP